jgi:hypothetical protein
MSGEPIAAIGEARSVSIRAIAMTRPGAVRKALSNSKFTTVLFGLTLLLSVVVLYLIDPLVYLRVMRIWVPESLPRPFADTGYIMGQLDCWRKGVDVYVSSPCDIYGQAFAYPPLWLRLWFLPSSQLATVPFGLCLGVGFICSLAVLPPIRQTRDLLLLWVCVASSATAYGVERGNVDLLIFVLAACVVVSAGKSLPVRIAGHGAIVLAALLKLYPVFLLVFIGRERRRVAIALGLTALTIGLATAWLWHSQWAAMLPNIPGPMYYSEGPGGRKLPEGLVAFADRWWHVTEVIPERAASAGLYSVCLLGGVFAALRIARDTKFNEVIGEFRSRERMCLIAGAVLFCGCFVAGTSIAYREILLLFAIPGLQSFRYELRLRPAVRWTVWIAITLMWSSFPSLIAEETFGRLGEHGGPVPTFAFWLLREIGWWWVFIVLAAVVFRVAGQSGLVRIDRTPSKHATTARQLGGGGEGRGEDRGQ